MYISHHLGLERPPIARFHFGPNCLDNYPELAGKVENGHCNSGHGLNATDSKKLATLIKKDLESGKVHEYKIKREGKIKRGKTVAPKTHKKDKIIEYLIFVDSEKKINWLPEYAQIEGLKKQFFKTNILMEKHYSGYMLIK